VQEECDTRSPRSKICAFLMHQITRITSAGRASDALGDHGPSAFLGGEKAGSPLVRHKLSTVEQKSSLIRLILKTTQD